VTVEDIDRRLARALRARSDAVEMVAVLLDQLPELDEAIDAMLEERLAVARG
jgi:hypothetical protein